MKTDERYPTPTRIGAAALVAAATAVVATVVALLLAAALLVATPAAAHQGDPNYRSTPDPVPVALEGAELTMLNFDDSIKLVNNTGKTIIIKGYEEEPYIRLNADGTVEVNVLSPAHYLNDDRYANVQLPERADATAEPEWELVDGTGQYSWHDHRAHWMGAALPPQVEDEDVVTKIFDYAIPVEVDGEPTEITGTLTWVGGGDGGFPLAAIGGLVALVVAAAAIVVIGRRRRVAFDAGGDGDGNKGGSDGSGNGPKAGGASGEAW